MPAVVVCPEPLAAEAGLEILRKGGNAIDAAVAASLAQGVVDPKMCGIGGHGRLLIYIKQENKIVIVDAMSRCGSKAVPGIFEYEPNKQPEPRVLRPYVVKNRENEVGYKAVTIPGYVAGIGEAHQRWGKLPWRELFQPSIRLGREGFRVYSYLVKMGFVDEELPALSATKAAKEIYVRNGRALRVGEILVQSDYANTLERLSREGFQSFYQGPIGERIAADFEKNDGLITARDLANYKAKVIEPMCVNYEEYEVYSDPPPGTGPMKLQALGVLKEFDLRKYGWNTPKYLDIMSRIFQLAMNDRETYTIDPDSDPSALRNAQFMISEDHILEQAGKIRRGEETGPIRPNWVRDDGRIGTSHVTAMDEQGNAVSFCHSIVHSSGVVTEGLGFLYNCHMSVFDPRPNQRLSLRPGRVPVVSPSPMMVFNKNELCMSIGSPAGPWGSTAEVQAILNVITFGMTMQQAVSVPRIHSDIYARTIYVEASFPSPYPLDDLRKMGHQIAYSDYGARLSAILRRPDIGLVEGGTDPRGGGGLAYFPVK